ncbi:hypothetical protein [Klebsiella pneumoniae]|nr:hypothetical protein [Klebsiella pneumoniae]
MSNSSVLLALSLFVQDASLKYATENNLSEAQNYMQLWRQNGEKMDVKASLKIYLMMELFLRRMVLMANTSTIFRFTKPPFLLMERGKDLVRNDALWDHQEQGEK